MDRIVIHWSAGTHTVSALDRQHYHFIIDGSGAVHSGVYAPEDNANTADGRYAAHTRNCNTGSIGVALAAMAGAVESPFSAGAYPITEAQVAALVTLCADLCKQYSIPVTRRTVLSHAEVQPTLGIKQAGKWDVAWLPGMAKPGDPVAVGDKLRAQIAAAMGPAQTITTPETVRLGSKGETVRLLQSRLVAFGYDLTADGDFGRVTEAAVKQFQSKRGLSADGIVGAQTWARLLA